MVDEPESTERGRRARSVRRWSARLFLLAVAGVGVASVVQAPYIVVRGAEPLDARAMPSQTRASTRIDADGALLVPVVDAHRAKWVEVGWYRLAGGARLEPLARESAAGREHGNLDPRRSFRESAEIALLVAAELAKVDDVRSDGAGVRVQAVGRNRSGSPLRSGDVVVEVAGDPVRTFAELRERALRLREGRPFEVRLADGTEHVLPALTATPAESGLLFPAHALGMAAVETERPQVTVPGFEWGKLPNYAGTSSGLGMALAAYERLRGEPLAPNQRVYASGEVGSDGGVYGVGDVALKAQKAREDGAELLLVPWMDAREARANAGLMRVVGVRSVADAVATLTAER